MTRMNDAVSGWRERRRDQKHRKRLKNAERIAAQHGGITDPSAALAQERSYSSYGEPEPLPPPQTQAPTNDTPWLPIALSIAGALAIVAVSATQLRRVRVRRRRAAHTPA